MQDDILWRCPTREPARELDTYEAGHLQLPRLAREHVYRIGTSYANSHHAQSSRIGSMGIRAYHHAAWKSVIL